MEQKRIINSSVV